MSKKEYTTCHPCQSAGMINCAHFDNCEQWNTYPVELRQMVKTNHEAKVPLSIIAEKAFNMGKAYNLDREPQLKLSEGGQLLPENIIAEQELDALACEYANSKYAGTQDIYPAYFGFVAGWNKRDRESTPVTGTAEEILRQHLHGFSDEQFKEEIKHFPLSEVLFAMERYTSTQSTTIERLIEALEELSNCEFRFVSKIAREALANIKK
jgi:hypothetical protein